MNCDAVVLEFKNSESLEFDFATIEIATNMFSEDSKIGRGGYGQVYKVIMCECDEYIINACFHFFLMFSNFRELFLVDKK